MQSRRGRRVSQAIFYYLAPLLVFGAVLFADFVDPAKRHFQIISNSPVFVDSSDNAGIDRKIANISRKYRSFL